MPRKSRKKSQPTSNAPTPIAAVLEQSPVAQLVANHEAEPEDTQPEQDAEEAVAAFLEDRRRKLEAEPEPERKRAEPEHKQAAAEPRVPASFAEAVKASRSGFAPTPEGFINTDSFPAAGLKVNRSRDGKVAALQFAEDRPLSRVSEYEKMREIQEAGFSYKPANRQWERYNGENPSANLVDAKRVGADLAKDREGIAV